MGIIDFHVCRFELSAMIYDSDELVYRGKFTHLSCDLRFFDCIEQWDG